MQNVGWSASQNSVQSMARTLWRPASAELSALWINTELSQKTETQLIAFSQSDELVKAQTHDATRFVSSAAIQEWLKGRELIVLESEQGDLLGIVWLGQKFSPVAPPEYQLTFAVRLYGVARGKGLATPFLKTAFQELKKTALWQENLGAKVWLATKAFNKPAIETYKTLGFQQFTEPDVEQEIVMLQTREL